MLGNKSKSKRVIPQIKPLRNVKKGSLSIFSKKKKKAKMKFSNIFLFALVNGKIEIIKGPNVFNLPKDFRHSKETAPKSLFYK